MLKSVRRYSTRFWNDVEKKSKKSQIIPEQDPFRWALEELRVSLFAQQLKTAYPVSVKRMDKLWDERG
jgi:ATP-dependent helicase HrpA